MLLTCQGHIFWQQGGRFKNAYELLNLRALKIPMLYKNRIFQCMGKIFCVEFQRVPLKFHTKYLTHTLKDVSSFLKRPQGLQSIRFSVKMLTLQSLFWDAYQLLESSIHSSYICKTAKSYETFLMMQYWNAGHYPVDSWHCRDVLVCFGKSHQILTHSCIW